MSSKGNIAGSSLTRWLVLLACAAAVALFVAVAHWLSPRLPGTAGVLFRDNVAENIDAAALFYTEAGDVRDFIDERTGKYRIVREGGSRHFVYEVQRAGRSTGNTNE